MRHTRLPLVLFLGLLFLMIPAVAEAACGDPGEEPCSCGFLGLGNCCDYDYLPLIGECSDASGFPTYCGGTNEPACNILEHLTPCKSGRTNVDGTCRVLDSDGYPQDCGGEGEDPCNVVYQIALGIGACKPGHAVIPFVTGVCRAIDADGFPTFCGGEGERPCNVNEHVPSCKGDLDEIPFPGGDCTRRDADGFPPNCGDPGERTCLITENLLPCKTNSIAVEGTCDTLDADGWPTGCGGRDEPACTLDVQLLLGVDNCKPSTVPGRDIREVPFGNGNCILLDEDGFPPFCGGDGERPCTVVENLPSCKPDYEEVFTENVCRDTYPESCGRNGQRPCLVTEKLIPCKATLSVRDFDFGECGRSPLDWPEAEVPRGGPRTVFIIHGRGGDLSGFEDADSGGLERLAHRLQFEVPNVTQVYGVDWNMAAGSDARRLKIRELTGTRDAPSIVDHDYGTTSWNATDMQVWQVARSLSEAIRDLPTEENITILTFSYGGVIGRHLVYRHYDELREDGKRIAEVVTAMAPHEGGGMSHPLVPGGEAAQDVMSCSLAAAGVDPYVWNDICELGRWHNFRERREDGILGPPFGPFHIDDRDYPQIRWVVTAQNGYELGLRGVNDGLDPDAFDAPLDGLVSAYVDTVSLLDNLDSDGVILTASQWGIAMDECYPFTRLPGPDDAPLEIAPLLRDNDGNGVLSAQCHHPAARVDSRYEEVEEMVANHSADVAGLHDFIVATLSLAGDINGDGVIDEADATVVAVAGDDVVAECTRETPPVTLDAGGSEDPAAGGLTFDWSGAFGSASGATPTIDLPLGKEIVTLLVEDSLGRTDDDTIEVEVVDTTAPTLDASGSTVVEATSVAGAPHAFSIDASDVCGAVDVARTPELDVYPLGVTDVAIVATDGSGNEASVQRSVEVRDTTPPQVTAPAEILVEATAVLTPLALTPASATDLFPVEVSSDAPAEGFPLFTTPVVWTATDANGNEAQAIQNVTVQDTTPPTLVVPADVVAEATGLRTPVEIGSATATDIFEVTVVGTAPEIGFALGETVVTWVATDAQNNSAMGDQRVTVRDTTPPTIEVPDDVTVVATGGKTAADLGEATGEDLFGPVALGNDAPADGYDPGTTDVTWTATDANGNEATAVQRVRVEYAFGGFSPPLQPGGVYKANRTLPVKLVLGFADGTPVETAHAELQMLPLGADDTPGEALEVDADDGEDSGAVFRYEDGQYRYNLNTRGLSPGRYRIVVVVDDGTNRTMDITLR